MHVRANFGQQPFMYDIDGLVKVCFSGVRLIDIGLTICRKKNTPFSTKSVKQVLPTFNLPWTRPLFYKNWWLSFLLKRDITRPLGRLRKKCAKSLLL
jgi:hypothetical protein